MKLKSVVLTTALAVGLCVLVFACNVLNNSASERGPDARVRPPKISLGNADLPIDEVGELHNEIGIEYIKRRGESTPTRDQFASYMVDAVNTAFRNRGYSESVTVDDISELVRWLSDLMRAGIFDIRNPTYESFERLFEYLVRENAFGENESKTILEFLKHVDEVATQDELQSLSIESFRTKSNQESVRVFFDVFESSREFWREFGLMGPQQHIQRRAPGDDDDGDTSWKWRYPVDAYSGVAIGAWTGNPFVGAMAGWLGSALFEEAATNPEAFGDDPPCADCWFPCANGPCF